MWSAGRRLTSWIMARSQPRDEIVPRGEKVLLRPKQTEDAWLDYQWRADPELARLDATYPLTTPFNDYRSYYLEEMKYPSPGSRRFAIETVDGLHIGNCMYYDLNPNKAEAELGILVGDRDYWSRGYGTEAVDLLVDFMFREMGLVRVYLKTLDWNHRAQKSFNKSGFVEYGKSDRRNWSFVLMEIMRKDWEERDPNNRVEREYPRSVFPQS